MTRGKLIIIEGTDKVGKTTSALQLVSKLREEGLSAVYISFPKRQTRIGQLINLYLQNKLSLDDHCIHLLFAANRWEYSCKIQLLLKSSINVIVDRYSFSGIAYSLAKEKNNLDEEFCKMTEKGLPKPDLVCCLLNSNQTSIEFHNNEKYEKKDIQERVSENFKKLKDENWVFFDALKNNTFINLLDTVRVKIEEPNTSEIKFLWQE